MPFLFAAATMMRKAVQLRHIRHRSQSAAAEKSRPLTDGSR
jgi:hypothetical protein